MEQDINFNGYLYEKEYWNIYVFPNVDLLIEFSNSRGKYGLYQYLNMEERKDIDTKSSINYYLLKDNVLNKSELNKLDDFSSIKNFGMIVFTNNDKTKYFIDRSTKFFGKDWTDFYIPGKNLEKEGLDFLINLKRNPNYKGTMMYHNLTNINGGYNKPMNIFDWINSPKIEKIISETKLYNYNTLLFNGEIGKPEEKNNKKFIREFEEFVRTRFTNVQKNAHLKDENGAKLFLDIKNFLLKYHRKN